MEEKEKSTCDVSWTGCSLVDFVGTSAKQKEKSRNLLTFPKIIKICQKIKNHAAIITYL